MLPVGLQAVLAQLIRTVRAFRKELRARPAGINAPDSRFASERIRTVTLAQSVRTVRAFRFRKELPATSAGINAPDSRFAAEEHIRTVALVSLSEFEALSAALQAMMAQSFRTGRAFRKERPATPTGINAPDSRFAAERIRTVALVSPSDLEALSAGLQAMLA